MNNDFYCIACGSYKPESTRIKRNGSKCICKNCMETSTNKSFNESKPKRLSREKGENIQIKKRCDDLDFQRELDKINKSLELEYLL